MARRKRRLASRVRDYGRQLLAFLFSNVGIVALVLGYTIAGAFMFQAIEGASEMERVNHMVRERETTADFLWHNITLTLNLFNETELKIRISKELHIYQGKVVYAVKRGWDGGRSARQWSFPSAMLYSMTVITTIGYGNLSPRTSWGKLLTILYALLGMPLFLLYLSNVGELLARWFKCLYALVCLCRGCPGFNRRRVARLRNQLQETSEAESIEMPEAWRRRINHRENEPDLHILHHQEQQERRPNYRSASTPHPSTSWNRQDSRRLTIIQNFESPGYPGPSTAQFSSGYSQPDNFLRSDFPEYRNVRLYSGYRNQRNMQPGYHEAKPIYQNQRSHNSDRSKTRDRDLRYQESRGFREYSKRRSLESSASSSDFTYVTFDAQSITVPLSVCVAIMVGYIIFGSMIFGTWEKWDPLDGAYFCFISLSSIGFGDFVPGERVYTPKIETSFIVCSLYLYLGMAIIAMCFSLMQEQVIHYYAAVTRAFRRICRCKR